MLFIHRQTVPLSPVIYDDSFYASFVSRKVTATYSRRKPGQLSHYSDYASSRRPRVRTPAAARDLSLLQNVETGFWSPLEGKAVVA